jgi:hypothetical protein
MDQAHRRIAASRRPENLPPALRLVAKVFLIGPPPIAPQLQESIL